MAQQQPISSGADPRLRHACDLIAAAGGRVVAGMLDDLVALIASGCDPRTAAETVLRRYAAADAALWRGTGANRWPSPVQAVPTASSGTRPPIMRRSFGRWAA